MEDKRLNFSDSKIKFDNININEDIIDIYLLYNGEIVNSKKPDSKNFHRIVVSEIGISKDFQQLFFELVNKIELTIKIKISNIFKKELSFRSRIKMYNKKPEESQKIEKSKKNKNNRKDNIITEEEKEDKINLKEEIIKIWNTESIQKANERFTLEGKNEKENKIEKIINEYESKIKELQSIISQKEKEIKELENKLNNEKEIVNILNKIRKPLITIKKENDYQFINNIKKVKPELIIQSIQSINDNKIELLGNKKPQEKKKIKIYLNYLI